MGFVKVRKLSKGYLKDLKELCFHFHWKRYLQEWNTMRDEERECSWYTAVNNWKEGKNCPEFDTVFAQHFLSCTSSFDKLFVLEGTLLLSYSTVLTNTSI